MPNGAKASAPRKGDVNRKTTSAKRVVNSKTMSSGHASCRHRHRRLLAARLAREGKSLRTVKNCASAKLPETAAKAATAKPAVRLIPDRPITSVTPRKIIGRPKVSGSKPSANFRSTQHNGG